MRVLVDAYSGYMANERPLRFTLGERVIEITEILDRWYGEDDRYFRVSGSDGHIYVLRYINGEDRWELTSFTRKGSQGTNPQDDGAKTIH
jgi:hypothetical protein